MYVRFIIRRQDADSKSWEGLFRAAYDLREAKLEHHEGKLLEKVLAWFKIHLKVPPCLNDVGSERTICWFRDTANKPITYARDLVWLLTERGTPVEIATTAEPGTIIYQDRWQIVAKPGKQDRIRKP